jgi:hypothetical protein
MFVPGSDDHIGLPIYCLQRVLVLRTIVLDSGSKVWIVLGQHGGEQGVVIGIVGSVLEAVLTGLPHLILHLWSS